MITIEFEMTKDGMTFRDAIVLEDSHTLSDANIETIKQKRFDDWYAIVTTSSEENEIISE